MTEMGAAHLYALLDMGSNGIRLSISSLEPPTTRALPTVYQSRLGISLYDAQYEGNQKVPIPDETISTIIATLKGFKQTSLDFGVPQTRDNVRILATEATRTAVNSAEFIRSVEDALGEPWKVDVLRKEDEGRIGALGVVSSVGGSEGIEGLMMDLGGGSTQLTWLIARPNTPLQTSPLGSVSFPYGAAAMTRLLSDTNSTTDTSTLHSTIVSQFRKAFTDLALPGPLLAKAYSRGLTLYLSGGGFRGWGYLLMSSHRIRPYPIPIINGFTVPVKDFRNTNAVSELAAQSLGDKDGGGAGIFRVSKRRAAQVPAVKFLVDALIEAIPVVSEVRFCQGGVREGWLFDSFPPETRAQDPLEAASARFAAGDLTSVWRIAEVLGAALPPDDATLDRWVPPSVRDQNLLRAFASLMYLQQGHSKESAAVNALHVPITGALANAHGAGHGERTLLSLMLCRRWGEEDDLPPPYGELKGRLELLLTQQEVWWVRYLGVVGAIIGDVYPTGRVMNGQERLVLKARWADGLGKKGNQHGVRLAIAVPGGREASERGLDLGKWIEGVEELGKKKNRAGGREYGYGIPLRVDIETLQ